MDRYSHILGCLLGTAVGDAAGLRREGLSRRRAERLYGDAVAPNLVFGRGLCSDDTEHTVMVGRALAMHGDDPHAFAAAVARQLKMWLLTGPAGVGFATLRACLKLLLGFGPQRSGVFSAGNGPAMRAALLGVWADSPEECRALVKRSTRLTHTDPKAEEGALVVAWAAGLQAHRDNVSPLDFLRRAAEQVTGEELRSRLSAASAAAERGVAPSDFADSQGWSSGISGYVNQTVPAALYCWATAPTDFRRCVEHAVRLGGDADSVAAIAGAVAGANLGADALPADWIKRLAEWPRTVTWMEQLAATLAQNRVHQPGRSPPPMHWAATIPRNIAFAAIVLTLGFRRLLPPY